MRNKRSPSSPVVANTPVLLSTYVRKKVLLVGEHEFIAVSLLGLFQLVNELVHLLNAGGILHCSLGKRDGSSQGGRVFTHVVHQLGGKLNLLLKIFLGKGQQVSFGKFNLDAVNENHGVGSRTTTVRLVAQADLSCGFINNGEFDGLCGPFAHRSAGEHGVAGSLSGEEACVRSGSIGAALAVDGHGECIFTRFQRYVLSIVATAAPYGKEAQRIACATVGTGSRS